MAARIFFNKKRGNALGEYALILGIVTIALVSMNVYMKRGIQGKVKDMTDYFIAPQSEHDENTDDEVFTTSSSD
ncbi:MAG: hypothetical protein KKE64_05660, partial [Candidatus Omnitrophica bacterium]|nr:hypothetical protein [Candidatus Omnitrophota bacterium]